jgi:hypothetical protein
VRPACLPLMFKRVSLSYGGVLAMLNGAKLVDAFVIVHLCDTFLRFVIM